MSQLAINGGPKIREDLFPDQNTMDENERIALNRVWINGRPSGYRACATEHFRGGPEIKMLEKEWTHSFNSNPGSAIACNSATSGLFIACAAIGLKPNDEVIVTPYSMTCSATIPLWFGAKPVFSDVEPHFFCIDPNYIDEKNLITSKTKAIIAVDLFGQPCDYNLLKFLIKEAEKKFGHKIYLITDTAQAPGSVYQDNEGDHYSGTIGDIGVFSLNFGKHMTCGEGGIIIAKDKKLNAKCRLVMNHAEAYNNDTYPKTPPEFNIIGLNLRMTEFQAAVAREQLKKLKWNIYTRRKNVGYLNDQLKQIPAVFPAPVRNNCTHTYYVTAYLWNRSCANGLHRDDFISAVKAELTPRKGRDGEGVQIGCGYIKPIYMMPWRENEPKISLPVVEKLWRDELFLTLYHAPNSTVLDMKDVARAFEKCWIYQTQIPRTR